MSEDIKELPNVLKELPNGKKPKSKPSPYSKASVVSIDDIHEDPANLRLHDSRNISTIESSLVALGPGRSIVLDAKDVIRAGNGTIQAAKNAGFKEVLIVEPGPDQIVAVKRADWTPTEARQYSVVDNRASEVGSTWDKGPLHEELEALQNEGIDIDSMGWSDEDVKLLSKELEIEKEDQEKSGSNGEAEAEPNDAEPEVNRAQEFMAKWGTASGQVWLVPSVVDSKITHKVMCGDSTNKSHVDKLMDGKRAQIGFTSPPYNAGNNEHLSNNTHTKDGDNKYFGVNGNDTKTAADYEKLLFDFSRLAVNSCDYLFVNLQMLAGNKISVISYLSRMKRWFCDVLVWVKKTSPPAMAEKVVNSAFEFIFVFSEKSNQSRVIGTRDFRGTVRNVHEGESAGSFSHVNEFKDVHAASFPLHLPMWIIESFSNQGELILEPFCGTGTTVVACENLGRACYAMEIAPEYVAVILERLSGIGLKPYLE